MDEVKTLNHPCKNTCSGWQQGFEAGESHAQKQSDRNYGRLLRENRHVKKLAEAWMHDYDKMVAKYEPSVLVGS